MPHKLFVITGPSATGKTYLASELLRQYPDEFLAPSLVTTRKPRPGEQLVDRQFVTQEVFDEMVTNNEFSLTREFNRHWYGYPKGSLVPKDKHLVVNTWPSRVPDFENLENIHFVGLTVTPDKLEMLRERMVSRGDSPQVVDERMIIIKTDLADLEAVQAIVAKKGRMFTISDNETIPSQVIPWIIQTTKY